MKKVLLTLTAMSLLSVSLFASSDPAEKKSRSTNPPSFKTVNLEYENPQKVRLTVLSEEKGNLNLSVIEKTTGKEIMTKDFNHKKPFSVLVNMSSIEGGQYVYKLEGDNIDMEQEVFLSPTHNEDVCADVKKNEDGTIDLKVRHDNVPVQVKIKDSSGRVYYSYTHNDETNFEQTVDISQINAKTELFLSISGKKSYISKVL